MDKFRRPACPDTWIMIFLMGIVGVGCTKQEQKEAPRIASVAPAVFLVQTGQRYAAQGRSVHAEQYYLAALEQGASREEVYSLLIDTCLQSGRLRSALSHVQFLLRRNPEDMELRMLSASLYDALGMRREAWGEVQRMSDDGRLSSEGALFVAEFYDGKDGMSDVALEYYEKYFQMVSPSEVKPWVSAARKRLKQKLMSTSPSDRGGDHEG